MNRSYEGKQEDIVRYENTHNSSDCEINEEKVPNEAEEITVDIQKNRTYLNKSPYASYASKMTDDFNFNADSENPIIEEKEKEIPKKEEIITTTENRHRDDFFSEDYLIKSGSLAEKKPQIAIEPNREKKICEKKTLPSANSNLRFNLDKYKVIPKEEPLQKKSPAQSNILSDSDIDIELPCKSKEITDFLLSDNEVNLVKDKNKAAVLSHSNLKSEKKNNSATTLQISPVIRPGRKQSAQMLKMIKINDEEEEFENSSKEDSEFKTIIQLKQLQQENQNLKAKLSKLPSITLEMEDMKAKLEQKTREYNDMKTNYSRIQTELLEKDKLIFSQRTEIRTKDEAIAHSTDENGSLKSELGVHKNELSKKCEKITESQQKIFRLEQELIEYGIKANADLKELRDSKQNYDALKMAYLDLKNQYDVIYLKLQSVNDENYNLKRDYLLTGNSTYHSKDKKTISGCDISFTTLEDSDKNLNFIGTKPLNRIGVSNNPPQSATTSRGNAKVCSVDGNASVSRSNNTTSLGGNEKSSIDMYEYNNKSNDTLSNSSTKGSLSQIGNSGKSQGRSYRKKIGVTNTTNMNIFPSQKDIVGKESKILEIETKLYALQQEREKVRRNIC